jgi:protease IV
MGKVKNIIITLILLWLVAFLVSKMIDVPDFESKIAVVPIKGVISGVEVNSLTRSIVSSDSIIKNLEKAEKDNSVKGIMLEINSPGGTVVGSKEVVDKVKGIEKPVVAYIREIGTSGAYWVASASDFVIADELSMTGSIGVVSSYLEFAGLIDDFNVTYRGLKTGEFKDIGSPFKELNRDEERVLQDKLDMIHDYFVEDVAFNRDLEVAKVHEIANGLFYLGVEAKELGLIDEFGNKDYAFNVTKQLANITEAKIVRFEDKKSFFDVLSGLESSFSGNNLVEKNKVIYAK